MRRGLFAAAAAAALMVGAWPAGADKPIPAGSRIVPDPALKLGTLSNGLRYAIMPNAVPGGAVSIRLAFDVGSYEERDDELGYAHFIEHMTFRSTRQAPTGVLDNRFGALGVALGRDQNAVTMLDSTVYRVDLPKNDMVAVRTVLDWMRGAADGILFTPETVGAERGVVLSELRERRSPLSLLQKEIARFQLPGARSTQRDPGGTEESVRNASATGLRAFHDRWYRPENATLVIVGDAPAEALLPAAEAAFGSWRAAGPAPTRPEPGKPVEVGGSRAFAMTDPSFPTAVSACRATPPEARGYSVERERRSIYSQLWSEILNARLLRRSLQAGSTALGSAFLVNRDLPDAVVTCLAVAPADGKWKEALKEGQDELRRFAKDGPTETEVSGAIAHHLASVNAAVYQADARTTVALADAIVQAELSGYPLAHPLEALRILGLVTDGTNAADVKQAFERDWAGTGPLLAASASAPLEREALLAAWQADEKAEPLTAYADSKTSTWPYWDFGKKGHIDHIEKLKDPDFVRYRFRNGTILNFKQTALESGGVEIRVRFGNGERGLQEKDRMAFQLASGLFPAIGLGKLDFADIQSAFAGTTWTFSLAVQTDAFVLSSSTLSDQVDGELRLLTAYMTDPGFRPTLDAKLPTVIDMVYRMVGADPSTVANDALETALFPNQRSMPPRDEVAALRVRDFERMLRPALTGMPAEVTIVGDVNEKYAKAAVAATFGALPPRPARGDPMGPGPFRHFPETLPDDVTGYHNGPADKAAAILVWPTYVATPERRREEYAIDLLGAIFQTRLMEEIRGAMGKVYSPSVTTPMPDHADQGYLSARFETAAADLEPVITATKRIAADLVAGHITAEELERARQPMMAAMRQMRSRNAVWAGMLSAGTRDPAAIRELVGYEAEMGGVTLDEVKAAASAWLKRAPMTARALPAPARTAAAAAARGAAQPSAPSIRPH
ncbi:MAG: zinc protease [Sphingomonadales bacterium]|jgi:zinc protease|nr:zinc protease [Sphingomonadales bacterium]